MAKVIAFDAVPAAAPERTQMSYVSEGADCVRFEIRRAIENCLFTDALRTRARASQVQYRVFGFISRRQHGHKVFTCQNGATIWLLQNGKLYDDGKRAVVPVDRLDPACLRGVLAGIEAFI